MTYKNGTRVDLKEYDEVGRLKSVSLYNENPVKPLLDETVREKTALKEPISYVLKGGLFDNLNISIVHDLLKKRER